MNIFLVVTQLENKLNYLGKNNLNVDNLQENHKEFIKGNKLMLKWQQRFRSKKYLLKNFTRLFWVLMMIKE